MLTVGNTFRYRILPPFLRCSLLLTTPLVLCFRNFEVMGEILSFGDAQAILPLICLEHLLAFVFFALLQILALLAALAPEIGLAANVVLYRWALS